MVREDSSFKERARESLKSIIVSCLTESHIKGDRHVYRYRGRTDSYYGSARLGRGSYRLVGGGRDAELRCDLARAGDQARLVSNVVWERVDRGYRSSGGYRRSAQI